MLLNPKRKAAKPHSEGSWAVSYVDMLTLLLCFFIVFYNSNAADPKSSVDIKKLFLSRQLNNQGGLGAVDALASRNPAAAAQATRESKAKETIKGVVLRLNPAHATISQQNDKGIELVFKEVSFFRPGSVVLTKEGLATVEELIRVLEPVKDQVRITVCGHTDSSGVGGKRAKYSDNWELSVLRATQVLKTFLGNQFDQTALSAEGFADTQVDAGDKAFQRRVTFKIEVKS